LGDGLSDLAIPGIGRVVLGFLITAGLAIGAAYAIRRFWPGLHTRGVVGKRVRALGHAAVSRSLTVHLVEVDGARVVIAEGRAGVSVTTLPADAGAMSTVQESQERAP
jgi:flagellar biogenesis protein FliO